MLKHPSIPRICQVVHGVHSFQLPVQYFVWKDISKEFCTNVHQIYFFVLSFLSSAYLRWQFLRTLCHLSVPHQWAINFQYMLGEISFQIFQILVYRYKYKYIDIQIYIAGKNKKVNKKQALTVSRRHAWATEGRGKHHPFPVSQHHWQTVGEKNKMPTRINPSY